MKQKQTNDKSNDINQSKLEQIKALISKRDAESIETLVDYLGDSSHLIAKEAINALIELGEPAIPYVIKVLSNNDGHTRHFATLVLSKLGARYMESVIHYIQHNNQSVREESVHTLKEIIRNTIKPLVTGLTQSGNHSRLRSLAILKKIGLNAKATVLEALKHENSDIHQYGITIMEEFGTYAIEPFMGALEHEDDSISQRAADSLKVMGEKAVRPLITAMSSENDWVREKAPMILSKMGEYVIIPLIDTLNSDNEWLRVGAEYALSNMRHEKLLEYVVAGLKHKSRKVRMSAARILGECDDAQPAVEPLIMALSDRDEEVRCNAAEALSFIGDKKAIPHLEKMLDQEDFGASFIIEGALMRLTIPKEDSENPSSVLPNVN